MIILAAWSFVPRHHKRNLYHTGMPQQGGAESERRGNAEGADIENTAAVRVRCCGPGRSDMPRVVKTWCRSHGPREADLRTGHTIGVSIIALVTARSPLLQRSNPVILHGDATDTEAFTDLA